MATSSMLPQGPGCMFWTEYDYMDQNMNWSDGSPAPAADNGDKDIRTDFMTLGFQDMFNREWGVQAELPFDYRQYKATDGGADQWKSLGDVRLEGIYTGFQPDMSAGVTFGVKLPTGNFTHDSSLLDRDLEIGTGSTDLLLGGFYRHTLNSVTYGLYWYAQVELDVPILIQDQY
ncbi:MAG TPA: hypothetical protein VGN61_12560, partial [Verrucomicrobiae bacterium]